MEVTAAGLAQAARLSVATVAAAWACRVRDQSSICGSLCRFHQAFAEQHSAVCFPAVGFSLRLHWKEGGHTTDSITEEEENEGPGASSDPFSKI